MYVGQLLDIKHNQKESLLGQKSYSEIYLSYLNIPQNKASCSWYTLWRVSEGVPLAFIPSSLICHQPELAMFFPEKARPKREVVL